MEKKFSHLALFLKCYLPFWSYFSAVNYIFKQNTYDLPINLRTVYWINVFFFSRPKSWITTITQGGKEVKDLLSKKWQFPKFRENFSYATTIVECIWGFLIKPFMKLQKSVSSSKYPEIRLILQAFPFDEIHIFNVTGYCTIL